MLEIDGKIVSLDLLREGFCCDLAACRGECCVEGNAGAPLELGEAEILEKLYPEYRPYMTPEGVEAIENQGFAVLDEDGDLTTTLVGGAECAYSFNENGVTLCAIERAAAAESASEELKAFPKPISCHLYPIRVTRFRNGSQGLNYHRWSICAPARNSAVPVYRALRTPIVRAFGEEFFEALEQAQEYLEN
jgi:hypothetical protein